MLISLSSSGQTAPNQWLNPQNGVNYNVGYGPIHFYMFEHELDITPDVTALGDALNKFSTMAGYDYPEGGMQALWPVLSAGEVYAGWDRPGTPRRVCSSGRWGYPCFRTGAIPIIVHVTDDEMHEGPALTTAGTANTYAYNASYTNTQKNGSAISGNYLQLLPTGTVSHVLPSSRG